LGCRTGGEVLVVRFFTFIPALLSREGDASPTSKITGRTTAFLRLHSFP